jgi:hypothetical protein
VEIDTSPKEILEKRHNASAPYWAIALIILAGTGIATTFFGSGSFWKGYVLDITGPAWNYILFRGLFTYKKYNFWTRFFTPLNTFGIFLLVCVGIETAQYLEMYAATFDPWDFLAYISLLLPVFLIDSYLNGTGLKMGKLKR